MRASLAGGSSGRSTAWNVHIGNAIFKPNRFALIHSDRRRRGSAQALRYSAIADGEPGSPYPLRTGRSSKDQRSRPADPSGRFCRAVVACLAAPLQTRLRSSTEMPMRIDNKLTVPTISIAASPRQIVEQTVRVRFTCDSSVGQAVGPQSTHYTQSQIVPA